MIERWTRGVRRTTVLVAAAALLTPAIATAQGKITGKVKFEGTPPAPAKLKMDADPVCAQAHPDGAVSEDIVVGEGGGLQNVFVYLKEVPGDFPAKTEPAVIDQKGCLYTPRVIGLQTGQPLKFLNSDPTLHNVHAMPQANTEFNQGMPLQGMKLNQTFTAPEVGVPFKCDVHGWMASYGGIVEHPYFAVTDATGAFALPRVPPGTYTVEVWHETLGTRTQTITVEPNGSVDLAVTFAQG